MNQLSRRQGKAYQGSRWERWNQGFLRSAQKLHGSFPVFDRGDGQCLARCRLQCTHPRTTILMGGEPLDFGLRRYRTKLCMAALTLAAPCRNVA